MSSTIFKELLGRHSRLAVLGAVPIVAGSANGTAHNWMENHPASAGALQLLATGEPDDAIGQELDVRASATKANTDWYFCINAGGTCTFSGTRLVRYGGNDRYTYKSATHSIRCDNTVFGDPAPGLAKACSISSSPSPYQQDATQYNLTFRDEFSGTARDTRQWNDHIWYEQSTSTHDYDVNNGHLRIWPQADSEGKFRSRILTTYQKFSQTYGYFEMEAKLPVGKGVWPAFWLLNSDAPPGEPEIDIMEAYPGCNSAEWAEGQHHPIAFESSFYQDGNGQSTGIKGNYRLLTADLSAGFHKYAVKWEPNRLSFYFDGKLYYTAEVAMNRQMYILADIQYGSESGDVDGTTPLGPDNAFQINYIRARQFK